MFPGERNAVATCSSVAVIGDRVVAQRPPTRRSTRNTWSITDEENPLQWKLKSPADVERLKKALNFGKVVRIAIYVAHSYRKMKDVMHHAGLKNILEKLIIVNGSTCLNLKDPALGDGVSVGVETLQYLAFATEKHGDNDLVFARLAFLHLKSELFQTWAESCHDGVAMLARHRTRIDGICHLLK